MRGWIDITTALGPDTTVFPGDPLVRLTVEQDPALGCWRYEKVVPDGSVNVSTTCATVWLSPLSTWIGIAVANPALTGVGISRPTLMPALLSAPALSGTPSAPGAKV